MGDLPELLLLRHGETAWNREGRMQGDRLDSGLTDLGRAQAALMGGTLAALGVSVATHDARTSPLGRAVATARIALSPLGLDPAPDARLREIGMGDWAGLTQGEIAARWPAPEREALFDFYARCEGGEGIGRLAARCRAVLAELRRPTVLVTHGITLRVLAALAAGLPAEAGGAWPPLAQGLVVRIRGSRVETLRPDPPPDSSPGLASPDPPR